MDDLIPRQAAIDLMLMAIDDDWEPDYATDRMNELPSAQPEVITCEHCKYRTCVEGDGRYKRTEYYCGYEYELCDPYEMTRTANDPNYFCADAKRRSENE